MQKRRGACVSGGGGYLGQWLAKHLENEYDRIVLLDVKFDSFPELDLNPEKVHRISGSILDRQRVREAIQDCEVFFHIAAYGMSGSPALNRKQNFLVNVDGTRTVLDECKKSPTVSRFVYTSSVVVIFDGSRELHFADENTPYVGGNRFNDAYAETKQIAEKAVLEANAETELRTCVLRLRGIYGPGEMRTTQRTIEMISRGLVLATFSRSEPCLTQYLNRNNAVHALALADNALRESDSRASGQIYHIVDPDPVHSMQFWRPLFEELGQPFPRLRIPFWMVNIFSTVFERAFLWLGIEPLLIRSEAALIGVTNTYSIEKARRELGYSPQPHDLGPTLDCLKKQLKTMPEGNEKKKRKIFGNSFEGTNCLFILITMFIVFLLAFGTMLI